MISYVPKWCKLKNELRTAATQYSKYVCWLVIQWFKWSDFKAAHCKIGFYSRRNHHWNVIGAIPDLFPRDVGVDALHKHPTVRPHFKVCTKVQQKNESKIALQRGSEAGYSENRVLFTIRRVRAFRTMAAKLEKFTSHGAFEIKLNADNKTARYYFH